MSIFVGMRVDNGYILLVMLVDKESGACKVSQIHYKHQEIDYFSPPMHG